MIYYSLSQKSFYDDAIHEPRTKKVPDPNWVEVKGKTAPLVEVPNPDTNIPADAVEISAEDKAALFQGQADGKRIVFEGGKVSLADQPPLSPEQLRANLIATRDYRLTASDWTQLADVPLTDAQKTAWRTYRKALRDLPDTVTDLKVVNWPEPPAK